MPLSLTVFAAFCSQYGAPSYYSPPVSGQPTAPGSASATHYGDWDGADYEDEDYEDEEETTGVVKKTKDNAVSSSQKIEEKPTYGTHSWWETPYTNYQAPPASNTW
jgi:hypothetical protein